ncbi:heavy metal translocating P-type ATPase [Xylanivirga thermophila]|uniref:heavy metal translocating P-type ATPase n=1 Tax=Xylanivirga thermophila TaxID=2496273 RepID=UPI00101BB612|nr:heavy metal translocating P-type ATPase [Xylanivirga thermophila]
MPDDKNYNDRSLNDREVLIPIEGMTCAACSRAVERSIGKLDGIEEVSVNLATEKAKVGYDPDKVRLSDIKEAVAKAGYKALDPQTSVQPDVEQEKRDREIKHMWIKFRLSVIFAIPLLYIAMGHMIGLPLPPFLHPEHHPLAFAIAQLILVIPIIGAGYKFYTVGFRALFMGSPNMDSLVAIGTSSALIYGIYAVFQIANGHTEYVMQLYFESAGVIITLILLGKTLESVAKGKTSDAIKKLMGLTPKEAIIIDHDGTEKVIPVADVEVGDIILVRPGERIPVDGDVIEGYTAIDESMLTGESIPVDKKAGDVVIGGSINKTGTIKFRTTKVGSDTVLSQIIKMVEDAQGSKAPIARLADIISGYFVPTVTVIAIVSAIAWRIAGHTTNFALTIFISVLVIACPCALGLATPTAIMVATGKGADLGILIKSGEALERLHDINTVIFDKTGTITKGSPQLNDIIVYNDMKKDALIGFAAAGERASEHPIAQAIVEFAKVKGIEIPEADGFEAIPGHGITCMVDGHSILIGNKKLMESKNIELEKGLDDFKKLANKGQTPMYVAIDDKLSGVIGVADVIKDTSKQAIEQLHRMGIQVFMITGDNRATASAIAEQVGIDNVLSDVLPQDKAEEVKKLQDGGRIVAMVGDGINDAPALAQADVGIAIASGTDIAMESADVVLMRNDLMDVPVAIQLSNRTIKNIKENLFWAFAYNSLGIPIAAGVLYLFGGPLLNPMIAAAAMAFSSVSVVSNALRLKGFKPEYKI